MAVPLGERPVPRDEAHKGELARTHGGEEPLSVRSPDRQAAMTVLGRRAPTPHHQELPLDRIDLRRARMSFAVLADTDLHYCDCSDAGLTGADLRRADLTGIWLAGSVLIDATLHQADLRTAVLWHARLDGADLSATDLTGADLTGAVVKGARFELADLRGADLTGTDLATGCTGSDFSVQQAGGALVDATGTPDVNPATYCTIKNVGPGHQRLKSQQGSQPPAVHLQRRQQPAVVLRADHWRVRHPQLRAGRSWKSAGTRRPTGRPPSGS